MNNKSKNLIAAVFAVTIILTMIIACSNSASNNASDRGSKIVGTWKRTDREVGMTVTFTADGDYIVKSATSSLSGKYELKNDNLRVYFPQVKDGKDDNSRIFKLEDNLMILEVENHGEKTYSKLEKVKE